MVDIAATKSLLDGKFAHDWVGIAYNTSTREIRRVGRLAGYATGSNPGDGLLGPVFQKIKRWTINDAGLKLKSINKNNKLYHDDMTLVDRTGASGQVMVVFDEAYYYEAKYGNWLVWGVSDQQMTDLGFVRPPCFVSDSWFANGAYEGSLVSGKLSSIAVDPADGMYPVWPVSTRSGAWGSGGANVTIAQMESWGKARGADWGLMHFWDVWWRILLFRIRWAGFGSQALVGNGRANLSGGSWINDSYIGRCGLGDGVTGMSGSVSNGTTAGYLTDVNVIDGVENFGGNLYDGVIGYLMNNRQVFYKNEPPYAMDSIATYSPLLDLSGATVVMPATEGYLGEPLSGKAFMFDAAHTGSSTVPVGDYIWTNSEDLRVGLSGAASASGSFVGVSAWSSTGGTLLSTSIVGGRLRFRKRRA